VLAVEDDVLVHLVADAEHVVLVRDARELPHVIGVLDRARRIRGGVHDERRGVLGDALFDGRGVQREVLA